MAAFHLTAEAAPVEFAENTVVLDIEGQRKELLNDFVWIFAGGVAPDEFLKQIGVQFGPQDVTLETVQEVREAAVV